MRGDLVGRAMRLIADGVVDRDGVAGLSSRLGYSTRHLNRLLTDELGAGPLALARAQRAQTARVLIETTDLTMTDIAYAAGFGSVRQFNDTVREVYAVAPSELRRRDGAGRRHRRGRRGRRCGSRCASRSTAPSCSRFLARTCRAGRRALRRRAVHAHAGAAARARHRRRSRRPTTTSSATFRLADWRDLAPAVGRVRHLLDLDADPMSVVDRAGRRSRPRARSSSARPGRGLPDRSTRTRRSCGRSSVSRSRSPAPAPWPAASPPRSASRSRSATPR